VADRTSGARHEQDHLSARAQTPAGSQNRQRRRSLAVEAQADQTVLPSQRTPITHFMALDHMLPWEIPPFPEHGDPSADLTFAAVGRAMSEWEELELYLARLYAKFLNIPPIQAIVVAEYKNAAVFRVRADVIEKAADKYFISRPDQDREADFSQLLADIRQLSSRRNDIAHGVVKLWWNHRETFSEAVDRNEYMLTPSTYMDKKFGDDRAPQYLFRSVEINRFADHFRRYRLEEVEAMIAYFPDV
jgi:hypothetical protein